MPSELSKDKIVWVDSGRWPNKNMFDGVGWTGYSFDYVVDEFEMNLSKEEKNEVFI